MKPAIRLEHLQKNYRRRKRGQGFASTLRAFFSPHTEVTAIADLSLRIEPGESVGLIGENGAGKSTTVKILTGILAPTAGQVSTLGLEPWKQRRRLSLEIGVVFGQKPQLLWDIPPRDSFRLLQAMYRVPDDVYRFTCLEAVERLEIGPLLGTPVRQLSLGQRMRCDFVAALLHAPRIAFLDEPTIGLDVLAKERIREHLAALRKRFGTTIVLTSHDLKDISTVCDRLLVLDKGRLLFDGGLAAFEQRFARGRSIDVELELEPGDGVRAALEGELHQRGAVPIWVDARRLRVRCSRADAVPSVMALLLGTLAVRDLSLQGTDIEALVVSLYRDTGALGAASS